MGTLEYRQISFLQENSTLNVLAFDTAFLERVISTRMKEKLIEDTDVYIRLLLADSLEMTEFKSVLNNSFSEFFREPLTFAYLEQIVLPMIIEKKKLSHQKGLRIWSATCASGQEAYSVAMLCDELLQNNSRDIQYRIFATDHNPEEIEKAEKGVYNPAAVGKIAFNRLQRYFTAEGNSFTVNSNLRSNIDFSVFDLLANCESSPPASIFGDFDLIFCCNVFFYYKPEFQKLILEKVNKSLSREGYLITGETEKEIARENQFIEAFPNSAIFQKRVQ